MLEKSTSIVIGVLRQKRRNVMANRLKQRENKKKQREEERLDTTNLFGKSDPTPFQAINKIIAKGKRL